MKPVFLFCALFLMIHSPLPAQVRQKYNRSLSVIVATDYDQYDFNTVFSEHSVHLSGEGWSKGIGVLYGKRYFRHWAVNIGAGYYCYGFNIHRNTTYLDISDPIKVIYSTKQYSYDCLNLSIDLNYIVPLKNGYSLQGGIRYVYYYSFSQKYNIPRHNSVHNDIFTLKRRLSYPFGNSIFLTGGLIKRIGKYGVSVSMNLPIWENWRKDIQVFNENRYQKEYHSKTGHGIGVCIIGSYYF